MITLLGLLTLMASGCADSPGDRVRGAWEARQQDDLEAYLGSFTERSRALFRGMIATRERTRGELSYLDPIEDLLPSGEILRDEERGELGVVLVASPKGEYEVICVRERGVWVIDGVALKGLWDPLKKATR